MRALADLAAEHAATADQERTLPPAVVSGLVGTGFAGHFVPARFGGADAGVAEALTAIAELGNGCASTAWCATVVSGAARMGVYLPEAGQRELWGDGPNTLVAGALVPSGRAEPIEGGWLVSGEWPLTSCVEHAAWALACALIGDDPWFFAVRAEQWKVLDTWDAVGMRGTGSHTLVLDRVLIPSHLGFSRTAVGRGTPVGSGSPAHSAPLRLVSGPLFAAPVLGAARGALEHWTSDLAAGNPAPAARSALARSTAEIDAAELLLHRAAKICDSGRAGAGELVRTPLDCAVAVDLLVAATERIVRAAGTRAQLAGNPVQRLWRDVHTMSTHVALRFDAAAEAYAEHMLTGSGQTGPRSEGS